MYKMLFTSILDSHQEKIDLISAHLAKKFGECAAFSNIAEGRAYIDSTPALEKNTSFLGNLLEKIGIGSSGDEQALAIAQFPLPETVLVTKPRAKNNFYAVVSCGKSRPDDAEEDTPDTEFMIAVPANWKYADDIKAIEKAEFWPIDLVKMMAFSAPDLSIGHTIGINGANKDLYPQLANFSSVLIAEIPMLGDDMVIENDLGDDIVLLGIYPLYEQERAYKVEHGTDALMAKFAENNVGIVFDHTRAPVV